MQVGVLLSEARYRRMLAGGAEPWHGAVLDQEQRLGVRTLVAPLGRVDVAAARLRMAAATPDGWREVETATPLIYFNRIPRAARAEVRNLRSLGGDPRFVVFNETNRWNRNMIWGILAAVPAVRDLIPPTVPYPSRAARAITSGRYLLAPARGRIRSHGLCLVWERPGWVRYIRFRAGVTGMLAARDLPEALAALKPGRPLLVAAMRDWPVGPGLPADWRVYLYRRPGGDWTVAAGVAKHDLLRSRHARERCWSLEEALGLTFGPLGTEVGARLRAAGLAVARSLSLWLPGLAHCAADFWLDAEGRPTLADLAGCYRTDWLRRAGESEAQRQLLDHPLLFARALLQGGVEVLHVDYGHTRP